MPDMADTKTQSALSVQESLSKRILMFLLIPLVMFAIWCTMSYLESIIDNASSDAVVTGGMHQQAQDEIDYIDSVISGNSTANDDSIEESHS